MVKILLTQLKEWIPFKGSGARAQDLTEYGLLVVLVAIVVILAVVFFGESLSTFFVDIGGTVAGMLN